MGGAKETNKFKRIHPRPISPLSPYLTNSFAICITLYIITQSKAVIEPVKIQNLKANSCVSEYLIYQGETEAISYKLKAALINLGSQYLLKPG